MVSFECGGANVTVNDNAQLLLTKRGWVRADELQQGDCVHLNGVCYEDCQITSDPVVS